MILFFVSSLFTKTFANEGTIAPAVLHSFHQAFDNAKDESWTIMNDVYKVEFTVNDQMATAYFNEEGKLLGVVKNILSTELPLLLENSLKKNFNDYWVTDLFELSNEDDVTYYVTLENAHSKRILKSSRTGWTTYEKSEK
jgi:hypothetical protein